MTYLALFAFIAVSQLAGIVGSVFTADAIPNWYDGLVRPPLNPPGWVFGPVWVTLYTLMGVAAWMIWKEIKTSQRGNVEKSSRDAKQALAIFALQLTLNAIWTPVFFGAKQLGIGFVVIVAMWLAIVWTIVAFGKINKHAARLLYPYLAWVSFASYLNFGLWMLNA